MPDIGFRVRLNCFNRRRVGNTESGAYLEAGKSCKASARVLGKVYECSILSNRDDSSPDDATRAENVKCDYPDPTSKTWECGTEASETYNTSVEIAVTFEVCVRTSDY